MRLVSLWTFLSKAEAALPTLVRSETQWGTTLREDETQLGATTKPLQTVDEDAQMFSASYSLEAQGAHLNVPPNQTPQTLLVGISRSGPRDSVDLRSSFQLEAPSPAIVR